MDNLGKRLQDFRQELDLTQQQLGDIIGTSRSSISAYERGSNIPESIIKDLQREYGFNLYENKEEKCEADETMESHCGSRGDLNLFEKIFRFFIRIFKG
jgi:transcriptional regulator with XRE-family HTH domain